jgi:hypothetical protein
MLCQLSYGHQARAYRSGERLCATDILYQTAYASTKAGTRVLGPRSPLAAEACLRLIAPAEELGFPVVAVAAFEDAEDP